MPPKVRGAAELLDELEALEELELALLEELEALEELELALLDELELTEELELATELELLLTAGVLLSLPPPQPASASEDARTAASTDCRKVMPLMIDRIDPSPAIRKL